MASPIVRCLDAGVVLNRLPPTYALPSAVRLGQRGHPRGDAIAVEGRHRGLGGEAVIGKLPPQVEHRVIPRPAGGAKANDCTSPLGGEFDAVLESPQHGQKHDTPPSAPRPVSRALYERGTARTSAARRSLPKGDVDFGAPARMSSGTLTQQDVSSVYALTIAAAW